MASTPTTKSQVQAYRFVIRRMESALVRKDPVMLHDPMRSHKRATVVGVILGAVGLLIFAIFGLFSPSQSLPATGIVIGAQSGQVYVISQNPYQLIPVFNVASARLLMMVEANHGAPLVPGASGSSSSAPQITQPQTISDDQLKNIPMGRLTGIPDGPPELPAPGTGTSNWAVCDQIPPPNPIGQTGPVPPTTTVLAGVTSIGTNLAQNDVLLVQAPNHGQEYLIYDKPPSVNNAEDDSAVAAPIDSNDTHVLDALHLRNVTPRPISAALLGAIPQVTAITNPVANLSGTPNGYTLPDGLQVGESFAVANASGPNTFFVALPDGLQQVSTAVAQIVGYEHGQTSFNPVPDTQISSIKQVTELNVGSYPVNVPDAVVDASAQPVACLGWSADNSNPNKPLVRTKVTLDLKLELPNNPSNPNIPMVPVAIGQPSPSGQKIDAFFMDPSHQAVAVHAATNANEFANGPIYIVSGRGVKYSVSDGTTAQGLGISNGGNADGLSAAPESILQLLPSSAQTLSTQNVMRTFDSVPVQSNAGYYITPSSQQNAPSGG
ncbi:MAG TPA: type VII secretion protein EccB [Pseudonocardiaceae bacterium]|nr:type VII secretion protein EccB [Pseudonocardiaceae bacterium]